MDFVSWSAVADGFNREHVAFDYSPEGLKTAVTAIRGGGQVWGCVHRLGCRHPPAAGLKAQRVFSGSDDDYQDSKDYQSEGSKHAQDVADHDVVVIARGDR